MTSTMWRHTLASAAIILTTIAAACAETQAPAATEQATISCPTGYLCLRPANAPPARPVRIKEGERRHFPGGLKISVAANQTRLVYCILSCPVSYDLTPRQEAYREHIVLAVIPIRICLT